MPRRFLIAAVAITSMILGDPLVAWAEWSPGGNTDFTASGSTLKVTAGVSGTPGTSALAAGGGGTRVCTWIPFPPDHQAIYNDNANPGELVSYTDQSNLPPTFPPPPGVWGMVSCPPLSPYITWVPTGATPPTLPSPAQLAYSALAQIHLGAPTMGMAPPTDKLIVNFATRLWIDPSTWRPLSATAAVGGISATVTATPSRTVWTMGDGNVVTCQGPGVAYDPTRDPASQPTSCTYSYEKPSNGQPGGRYVVSVRVYWHVAWTSRGVAGGGDLGEIAGDPRSSAVTVDVVRAVVVR